MRWSWYVHFCFRYSMRLETFRWSSTTILLEAANAGFRMTNVQKRSLEPRRKGGVIPETRVVSQVLNTSPGVVTAWLEFHGHLQGETHWLLVLLVTHACKNMNTGQQQE